MGYGSPSLTTLTQVISQELPWPSSDIAVPCPVPALNCRSAGDTASLACAVGTAAEAFPGVPTVLPHPHPRGHGHRVPRTVSSPAVSGGTEAAVCVPKLTDVTLRGEGPYRRDNKPWGVPRCAQLLTHTLCGSTRRVWATVRSGVILCPDVCVHTC